LSIRQACAALNFNRSSLYYKAKGRDDQEIIELLSRLVEKYPRNGFKKLYFRIRNLGYDWNHKRIYRLYKKLGLNIRRKMKKRLPLRIKTPLTELSNPNHFWSMDFIRPGKPTENARVERLNGSMRRELLDCHIFTSLSEVREMVQEWMTDYNHHRPHEALGNLSPIQFLKRHNHNQILSA